MRKVATAPFFAVEIRPAIVFGKIAGSNAAAHAAGSA
jgi:hypothetical protein